ncbi:MAG TPA: sn-glycerol-3-phosphate ABC transporter ATP-binding protein UgpC [Caldilineaceae bacterium]|nr:sn-glycerol-3-phosphate ABC transporter ATP-binding protein UgpC [Caldilineaceae bacterium]
MATVVCRNLTKHYGDEIAVNSVNLEVREGEFLVIVGPSGCGKTTTLRMIAGLETVSSGEILIDGQVMNRVEPRHRDIAMVFQNYALYPHKKVYDNIAYPLQLRRIPKAEIERRVVETARLLGIEPLLQRRIRQLSGGERQRVALGRAIVRHPRLFLMDEPLSNLDAQLRIQMRREIIRLQRQLGITTVYVTHDQVEAMTMGDRIVVMRGGYVQQVGDPVTIYNHPANQFVARFIGSPPMNLFAGTLAAADGALYLQTGFGRFALAPALRSQLLANPKLGAGQTPVVCGIRAEDVHVRPANGSNAGEAQGMVDLIEPLGSDNYVSIALGQEMLLARARPDETLQEAAPVQVTLGMERMHFFDPDSGNTLLPLR